jgi:hypothetical protein
MSNPADCTIGDSVPVLFIDYPLPIRYIKKKRFFEGLIHAEI